MNMAAADPNGIGKPLFDPPNAKVEYVTQPWVYLRFVID